MLRVRSVWAHFYYPRTKSRLDRVTPEGCHRDCELSAGRRGFVSSQAVMGRRKFLDSDRVRVRCFRDFGFLSFVFLSGLLFVLLFVGDEGKIPGTVEVPSLPTRKGKVWSGSVIQLWIEVNWARGRRMESNGRERVAM